MTQNKITYKQIMSFNPCYDPKEIGMPEDYKATIIDFIKDYRTKVKSQSDIIWTLCRKKFMTKQELRLYAVWCARQVKSFMDNKYSLDALDITEKYANNEATKKELKLARLIATKISLDTEKDFAYQKYGSWFHLQKICANKSAATACGSTKQKCYLHNYVIRTADLMCLALDPLGLKGLDDRDKQINKLLEIFEGKQHA